jgi:hypothetical protein
VAGLFIAGKEISKMPNRAQRRAAERQSLPLAAPSSQVITPVITQVITPQTASEARILANRANAQSSTGPRTAEGKAKSSLNAVKTGLTGHTVLLPTDDALVYRQHLDRYNARFSPATDQEKALVQTIADTEWRLLRIAPLEASIYAIGRRELADQFADEADLASREALLLGAIFMTYRRDLNNLALQERRLRNQRAADIAELKSIQTERLEKAAREPKKTSLGFDFSPAEFQIYNQRNRAQYSLTQTDLDLKSFLAAHRAAENEVRAA